MMRSMVPRTWASRSRNTSSDIGLGHQSGLKRLRRNSGSNEYADVIDIAGLQSGIIEREFDRALRKLVRIVDVGQLAVLDAIEALFLDRHHQFAIHEQRGRRIVVHGVNSKNVHSPTSLCLSAFQTTEPFRIGHVAACRAFAANPSRVCRAKVATGSGGSVSGVGHRGWSLRFCNFCKPTEGKSACAERLNSSVNSG